jgi:hypothetical protein
MLRYCLLLLGLFPLLLYLHMHQTERKNEILIIMRG